VTHCQKLSTAKIIEFVEKSGRIQFDERVRKDVNFEENLDASLVDQFMTSAKIKNVFQDKVHILSSLGVVKQVSGTRYFTNAGILFFTTTPSSIIKQAQITCVAFNGTEKVDILDRKDFKDDLITNIDSGLAFLRRHLNEASHIKGLKREDVLEIPLVALREALVNAVAHRNYLETGAHIMIEIYSNRVIISNPGGLPDGLTEKDFGKYSLSRNPVISDLLLRAGLIEKLGTGVNRIKDLIKEAKLPEPEFHFNNFFAVTFFRESAEINQIKGGAKSSAKLTDRQQEVLNLIIDNNQITKTELAEKLGINVSAVQKQIENLKQKGILKRIGPKFGGNWEVIKVV
jgi:ATP-dependent DNA helicase RecG